MYTINHITCDTFVPPCWHEVLCFHFPTSEHSAVAAESTIIIQWCIINRQCWVAMLGPWSHRQSIKCLQPHTTRVLGTFLTNCLSPPHIGVWYTYHFSDLLPRSVYTVSEGGVSSEGRRGIREGLSSLLIFDGDTTKLWFHFLLFFQFFFIFHNGWGGWEGGRREGGRWRGGVERSVGWPYQVHVDTVILQYLLPYNDYVMICGLGEYILVHCETSGFEVGVNFFLMYKMRMHFGTEGMHLSQQFLHYSTTA